MSPIQEQYESLPYPHYVHPLSHPARLAAVGRILGSPAANPAAGRVLDLGCGAGSNLLAMAERMPGSQFLGVDFSAPDIASAQAVAKEAGLGNIEFRHADLMDWEAGAAKFDYIIAYGLFSWVPDAVKDRLLVTIRKSLAPQGIACVSYMTYPGCKSREALRDLLRLRTEALAKTAEKVAAAHATLDFLDRAWRSLPQLPHAGHLREEARRIRAKEPHYLLLDDLGVERDPCYLLQFTGWAAEHGLRYLGESEFHSMLLENLPAESARELAAMRLDRLETEHMLDYVTNRAFRCSLLVGPEATVSEGMQAGALRELSFRPLLQPKGKAMPRAAEGHFITEKGAKVRLRSVPLVAFVRALAERNGASSPFTEVLEEAQRLAGREFTPEEEARLCEDLLTLYGRRHLELSALSFSPPPQLPPRPRLTPLNAAMSQSREMVVTAAHDSVRLTAEEKACCALLNGTRTLAEIRATTAGQALGSKLESHLLRLSDLGCLHT